MSRRFQFSLRALLVLTAVVSLLTAWILQPLYKLRRQRQIAASLLKRGVEVEYGSFGPPQHPPPGPAWARWLYGNSPFVHATAVTWRGDPPNEEELELLGQLGDLRRLCLAGVPIDDPWLQKLGRLENLEELDLRATAVTDSGLEQFPPLPKLKRIFLAKTNITDDGIARLRRRVRAPPVTSISW